MSKVLSTNLSNIGDKSLSDWNEAIAEAKARIKELKDSIKTFESLRDEGMRFPAKPVRRKVKRAQPEP